MFSQCWSSELTTSKSAQFDQRGVAHQAAEGKNRGYESRGHAWVVLEVVAVNRSASTFVVKVKVRLGL
jgi:hypothetical protein